MNILKTALACAAVATFSYTAMAATPKGETKSETATIAPSEAKTTTTLNTYYVRSKSGSNYTLATTPPAAGCSSGESPCEITSPNPLGSTVSQESVDNEENGIEITEFQPQL